MSENRVLYEFPHSHFCEIARWALDYKGLSYTRKSVLPGYHTYFVKKFAPQSHVPLLFDNKQYIQGSNAILNYLQENYPEHSVNPSLPNDQIASSEAKISATIGVPLRRLCYAHLLDKPQLVRYFFMHRSSILENFLFRVLYPILSNKIRDTYDCTEQGAESAKLELSKALDEYDALLEKSEYLAGNAFSRLDITFASLAVFMVMPDEYPVAWPKELKSMKVTQWFNEQKERASYRFVERMYQQRYAVGR